MPARGRYTVGVDIITDADAYALHGERRAYPHPRIPNAGYALAWNHARGAYDYVVERPRVRVRALMQASDARERASRLAQRPGGRTRKGTLHVYGTGWGTRYVRTLRDVQRRRAIALEGIGI